MPRPLQLDLLFLVPTAQRRRGVSAAMYADILRLRRAGISVYAEGRQHRVGGRLLDTRQFRRFAAAFRQGQSL